MEKRRGSGWYEGRPAASLALCRAVANEAAEGAGFEALAATHSRELAKVISDIAAAIRAEAAVKR